MLENLGPDVPLHFTAFHPDFKLQDKPRNSAGDAARRSAKFALDAGLHYVTKATSTARRLTLIAPAVARFWSGVPGTMSCKIRFATGLSFVPAARSRDDDKISGRGEVCGGSSSECVANKYDELNL